jgi:flagellar biosynthesis regulator FlaF
MGAEFDKARFDTTGNNDMQSMKRATSAYAASAAHRSLREQDADIFRRANAAMLGSSSGGAMSRARALADNGQLWRTVMDLMRDAGNPLPSPLRAGIVSIGLTVQREMQQAAPNFEFLIAVNENIAAGLSGQP